MTPAPRELGALSGLLFAAVSLLGFANIASSIGAGDADGFDRAVLLHLHGPDGRPIGPLWLAEAARDATALGSLLVLGYVTACIAGYLLLTGKRHAAALCIVSVAGGTALAFLLKHWFERPRPDLVSATARVFSASFPSAHAMMAAVTYLTLGALLMRIEPSVRVKAYVLTLAVATTMLVGVSRVYLGVHWPTDVMAGWCVGVAWALICWFAAVQLQRRGAVEPTGADRP